MKALMRLLDRGFVLRALMIVMLYSLIPFGECLLLVELSRYVDPALLLSLVAATTVLGFLLAVRPIRHVLDLVHESIDEGYYPEEPFAALAGTLVASVLLVTPGLATDVIGLVLFLPFLRRLVGKLITVPMRPKLKELYEYIKLYER